MLACVFIQVAVPVKVSADESLNSLKFDTQ